MPTFFDVPDQDNSSRIKNDIIKKNTNSSDFEYSAGSYKDTKIDLDDGSDSYDELGTRMQKNADKYGIDTMFMDTNVDKEADIMKHRIKLRSDSMYQFVMLVCGFAKIQVEKVLRVPQFEMIETNKKGKGNNTNMNESAIFIDEQTFNTNSTQEDIFTKNLLQKPQISGIILLDPVFYAHLQEAYDILKDRQPALEKAELKHFMEDKLVRTKFARLIAIRIQTSGVFSGNQYFPDKTRKRLLAEQAMIYHFFKKILFEKKSFDDGTKCEIFKKKSYNTNNTRLMQSRYAPY